MGSSPALYLGEEWGLIKGSRGNSGILTHLEYCFNFCIVPLCINVVLDASKDVLVLVIFAPNHTGKTWERLDPMSQGETIAEVISPVLTS